MGTETDTALEMSAESFEERLDVVHLEEFLPGDTVKSGNGTI